MKIEQYYDLLAKLIRKFLDGPMDIEDIMAYPNAQKNLLETELDILFEKDEGLIDRIKNAIEREDFHFIDLLCLISKLDEYAYEQYEHWLIRQGFEFQECIQLEGLNSAKNQLDTEILLIPRYSCMWEGKSRYANHCTDINLLLKHSYVVVLKNGKVAGKYRVKNYIMDKTLFASSLNEQNESVACIGLSPLMENIKLAIRFYTKLTSMKKMNCFSVKKHNVQTERIMIEQVKKVIRKADEMGSEILVFPEMIGTDHMPEEVSGMLSDKPLENIKICVLPSIWQEDISPKKKNTNSSYILDYCGDILFAQEKLKRYPLGKDGECYYEDIVVGDIVNLIHIMGYGSVAVLICKSELDEDVRNMLIKDLNVKLLLCPSWSSGESYEFETSIMGGAERCCNTVWCNTCSALKRKEGAGRVVGIITGYGKNHKFSQLDLRNRRFPEDGTCNHQCKEGCIFRGFIYGTEYPPEESETEGEEWEGIKKI